MPETLRDYLQAPMPFLIGLPVELMDFRGLQMDEVTLIDLDLGTCSPKPGSENDDAYVSILMLNALFYHKLIT